MKQLIFAIGLAVSTGAFAGTSIPTTRPTTQMALAELAREVAHVDRVKRKLAGHPELAENAYVRLELAVARRFIDRLQSPGSNVLQQAIWAKPQMEEVALVLNDLERTIERV